MARSTQVPPREFTLVSSQEGTDPLRQCVPWAHAAPLLNAHPCRLKMAPPRPNTSAESSIFEEA